MSDEDELRAKREAELEALRQHLESELERFKESCRTTVQAHFQTHLESLQVTVERGNIKAKELYQAAMTKVAERRANGSPPFLIEMAEQVAYNMYKRTLEFNQILIDKFTRECTPP